MKPRLILILCIIISVTACNDSKKKKSIESDVVRSHWTDAPENSILGSYTGMFVSDKEVMYYDKDAEDSLVLPPNKITLFIDKMKDGSIEGWSVCAGNDRPFKGTYTENDEAIKATVKEPGDGKYDGTFTFEIYKSSLAILGTWKPFNSSQVSKHYRLFRKNFAYNVSAGNFPESSERLLTPEDVENMYKQELRTMRNAIYARHGYSFKLREMREIFDEQEWYIPISTDVRKKLTSVEIKNEALIKRYEKYAEEYYDDYGR
jgi:hypothetical protein